MAIEKSTANPSPEPPLCFVISPIGPDDSDIRKIADKVLKHIITKALSERYKIQRADEIAKPGLITAQVVERLLGAPLVVADLSDRNANVYYELAIRHAADKPVIHIIADSQDAPFDVKDMRLIPYNLQDPDSIDRAQEKIRDQASEIEKGDKSITPVQVAQILAQPAAGGDKDGLDLQMLQAIYNAIASLQQELRETKEGVRFIGTDLLMNPPEIMFSRRPNAANVRRGDAPRGARPAPEYKGSPAVAAKPVEEGTIDINGQRFFTREESPSKDSPNEEKDLDF
jgi:hypothetical protein